MQKVTEKLKTILVWILFLGTGFGLGSLQNFSGSDLKAEVLTDSVRPETSIVEVQKIEGDELHFEIFGKTRVLWTKDNMVENDGVFSLPIGQIRNENDLKLESFPYIGNSKTMKFYPSNSYPARGTAPEYRRYFLNKKSAVEEGFIPMKNMK